MSDTKHPKLGEILTTTEERDAIHIAIAPVIAGVELKPGEHIGFAPESKMIVITTGLLVKHIGIVDPYLTKPVKKGEQFYIFLYPRTVTSLKHVWTHPDFEVISNTQERDKQNTEKTDVAYQWLTNFATDVVHMSLNSLLNAADEFQKTGDYQCLSFDTPDECHNEETMILFWQHYETLTNNKPKTVEGFFRCAC